MAALIILHTNAVVLHGGFYIITPKGGLDEQSRFIYILYARRSVLLSFSIIGL
jgi:hypothetical protein